MRDMLHISIVDDHRLAPAETHPPLDFCLLKLYVRHLSYYTARVAELRAVEGTWTWRGSCPFCDGEFRIDALSGWATCWDCGHMGDPITLEFILFGERSTERWDDCRRQAEGLMAGPLADASSGAPAAV